MFRVSTALLLVLVGCAQPPTELERAIERERDYERWILCRQVYRKFGGVWFSNYHHERNQRPRLYQIRSDLANNDCRRVLGKHWD